jgi:hypothetical protein
MKQELLVEAPSTPGVWTRLDMGGETPVMTFQINDLNDLKDRQASYSQALSLPLSAHNRRVFNYADLFTARSASPYRIYKCRWYVDGFDVLGQNFRLELRGVKGAYFDCQIVSNATGLIETLQNTDMVELSMNPVLWSVNNIFGMLTHESSDDLITWAFPITTQKRAGEYGTLDEQYQGVLAAEVIPYFNLLNLVREILTQQGYTLDTDVTNTPGYVTDYISLADFKPGTTGSSVDNMSMYPLNKVARGSTYAPVATLSSPVYLLSDIYYNTFQYGEIGQLTDVPDPEVETEMTSGYQYCAPGYMKVRIMLTCVSNPYSDSVSRVRYRVSKMGMSVPNGMSVSSELNRTVIADYTGVMPGTPEGGVFRSDEIELAPGDRVYCEIILLSVQDTSTTYYGLFSVDISEETNAVPAGGYLYPQESTNFKAQLDVIKAFIQLYGLFVTVDEVNKVFRAYSIKQVMNRATSGDYADWSGKIDIKTELNTTFSVGSYARNNRILFNNNELLGVQKNGSLPVNNSNLALSKDLFTIPVETGVNGTIHITLAPQGAVSQPADIDIRYTSDDGVPFFYQVIADGSGLTSSILPVKYRASKTHIVQMQPVSAADPGDVLVSMLPTARTDPGVPSVSFDTTICRVPVAVDPQYYVDTYYGDLRDGVLNLARVIEASFLLTPLDVMSLDLLRPVYISRYGSFFYVQKISNYGANKLTKVTLVAINT